MLYVLLGLVLLVAIILATPLSLAYDSLEKRLQWRWLGLTITSEPGREKPVKPRKSRAAKKQGRGPANLGLLWQRRDLVRELIGKLLGFAWELCRTLTFRDSEATFSLPDPMWNGMLYAVLTQVKVQNVNLSVNFEERNYAKISVTIFPYRVFQKLVVFLLRFPYLRVFRLAWDLRKPR